MYVFVKPKGGWTSETETAKLTASDGARGDFLGASVAIQRDTIVAGAPSATVNGNGGQGAAYVFAEPRRGWANETEIAKLTASDGAANDNLGWIVGLSGDTFVAGALFATENGNAGQGAAYAFWCRSSQSVAGNATAARRAAQRARKSSLVRQRVGVRQALRLSLGDRLEGVKGLGARDLGSGREALFGVRGPVARDGSDLDEGSSVGPMRRRERRRLGPA